MNWNTLKKALMALIGCVAFITAFTSCSESIDSPVTAETEELSITVSSEAGSKSIFSDIDRKILWSRQDILFVYDGEQTCMPFTAAVGSDDYSDRMKFTCKTWPKGKTPMWVVYNGKTEADTFADRAEGKFTTEIPSVQTTCTKGSFGEGAGIMAGKATQLKDSGYEVEMKNLCGIVRFEIANAYPNLSAISLSDADGKDIAGTVEVFWSDGKPVCSIADGKGRKNVTFRHATKETDNTDKSDTAGNSGASETHSDTKIDYIEDGAYCFCILGGLEIKPVITFTLENGKQAAYKHHETVRIDRNSIADLGITDGSIEFDKPYIVKFDFLNWNDSFNYPTSSDIDAKSKIQEFYGKRGVLIETSAPLGRSAAYGLYSYSEMTAGSTITLPAFPGMKLSKVSADLGGMPSKGYPSNSGAPFIADFAGKTVKGGEPASSYSFVIPEQGDIDPDSEPYTWTLTETEQETNYLLTFTESVSSFGMQSLTLYYTGEEDYSDISGVITENGESSAIRQISMTGSFTTDSGMYSGTEYGFRYRAASDDEWTYIAVDEHNGGRFSATVDVKSSGDYIFCAYAGIGNKNCMRRYGSPKSVHVAGESVTLETLDFTASDALPAKSNDATDEMSITSSDGYVYKVSGQVIDGSGKVIYYKHDTEKSLYFARVNEGGTVDNNACGFIELPAPEGCVLKSIDIVDNKSSKTYRVYGTQKSVYESADKNYLGSVANVKTDAKVTLKVSGATAGEKYYLCCPIFSYVNSITLTYEK